MAENLDWRHLKRGWKIPSEGYCDQPYLVKTDDGAWLCIMTTGSGHEGQSGQHIVSTRSMDQGRTWSELVDVEPGDGVEASYAVLLKVPSGRIYAFYNHNTDNVRQVKAENPPYEDGYCRRVDSLGHFVFKVSDDHGQNWSSRRYDVPVREMAIDRENADGGQLRYFWNVGKTITTGEAAHVSLHKVGGFGEGFFTRSEGVLLKSENILVEKDPEKITWQTLPDGDAGLRTPPGGGPIAEEQSYSVLSDGSFYSVYRTIDGHPACAYSRDGGHSWTTPKYKAYDNGRLMKHPRAANFAWRCENGHFLYWFHNHGGRFILDHPNRPSMSYQDRNPVWLCGGQEVDTPGGKVIQWSQPEIVMYEDDPYVRMSYPDFIEEDGKYYLTETQKEVARVHEVDATLLEGLWGQFENRTIAQNGCVLSLCKNIRSEVEMPMLPAFSKRELNHPYGLGDQRAGFTLDVWVQVGNFERKQVFLDTRLREGTGICLQTTDRGTIEVVLNDGRTENRWDCDPNIVQAEQLHHLVVIVDGGPKVITFVVDGVLCDGGSHRQFGWGRFSTHLYHVNGSGTLQIGLDVKGVRIYNRYLLSSEAVGNFRAGLS